MAVVGALVYSPPPADAAIAMKAKQVATLTKPVAFTVRTGDKKSVYIAQKNGELKKITCFKEIQRGSTETGEGGIKKFKLTIPSTCMRGQ